MSGYRHIWEELPPAYDEPPTIICKKCRQPLQHLHLQLFVKTGKYDVHCSIQETKERIQEFLPCKMSDEDFLIKEIIE